MNIRLIPETAGWVVCV